nr:hypothetical protein HK105_001741 [Polyrhizophydium stewartii]
MSQEKPPPGGAEVQLAAYFKDLGYGATYSSNTILAVLEQVGIYPSNAASRITESELARLLSMMALTHTGLPENPSLRALVSGILSEADIEQLHQMTSWNIDLFFSVLVKMSPGVNWTNVLRNLDQPETAFPDPGSLAIVLKASKAVLQDIYLFPIAVFLDRWSNQRAQINFLRHTVQIAPELLAVTPSLSRRVIPLDTPLQGNLGRSVLSAASISPWNSLDLIQCIMSLGDSTVGEEAKMVVELGIQQSPDLILLGFAQLSALSQILETKPYSFSIDLAALASRREYLNLEKWLQEHIRDEGPIFVRACLEFLSEKVSQQLSRSENLHSVPLSVDVVGIFLRILRASSGSMPPELADMLRNVLAICHQAYPRLANNGAEEALFTEGTTFPLEIEREANSYYERLYEGDLTIPQVVEMLQRLKVSGNPRDQETFRCVIHNLFDEYKFFPRYPERELAITSVLFGVLIQNQIVTAMALGMALRYVLEALRQEVGSKLFKFGLQALMQFLNRLAEWPQYCGLLVQIEHLHEAHPELIQTIKNAQKQVPVAGVAQGPGAPGFADGSDAKSKGAPTAKDTSCPADDAVFKAINLDSLVDDGPSDSPPENLQDKILFIVNNVSSANLSSKVSEMSEILKPEFFAWFSHYLVVKRASIEPNFHSLYIALLDSITSPALQRHVLRETLHNIRILLNSEKTLTSSQERSLLKNLGTWLGGITLAKNKPIRHKNLAFKELLLEGYKSSRLIVVIPFVCKVLEQSATSIVFRPPNPWLMAIMRLLAELYHFAELKLNLKFEIEVLCKNIKLDVTSIQPTDILRLSMQRQAADGMERDATNQRMAAHAYMASAAAMPGPQGAPDGVDDISVGYPSLASYITFNPNIAIFATQPSLKRIVHIAIDRSIREVIMSPVVERSVTIAVIASRELVVKDFALEPSEDRMRKAAHLMSQSLAGASVAGSVGVADRLIISNPAFG